MSTQHARQMSATKKEAERWRRKSTSKNSTTFKDIPQASFSLYQLLQIREYSIFLSSQQNQLFKQIESIYNSEVLFSKTYLKINDEEAGLYQTGQICIPERTAICPPRPFLHIRPNSNTLRQKKDKLWCNKCLPIGLEI